MKKIGLTTTVPIEVLLVAGYTPIDLNNIFITDDDYMKYIDIAERDGFPKSLCSWIKGIYGVCITHGIKEILGVVGGDCSNTKSLVEVLQLKGIKVHPFSYPHTQTKEEVEYEIRKLINYFNVDLCEVERKRTELNEVRALVKEIDKLTYEDIKVSGFENHLYQISCSDFNGNIPEFKNELEKFIINTKKRETKNVKIRLGYIGIPPMTADLYSFVEKFDAEILYNEVQREFSFPRTENSSDIFEQYYDYTYPYSNSFRIEEIKKQMKIRKLDGIIHYTQAFCHRAIDDIIIKEKLDIPILNIEGDRLNKLDARTKLRLEAFLDMLLDFKEIYL